MSKYGVYIIEFLRTNDYKDGKLLSEILNLSKIPSQYYWVNSKEELIQSLKNFNKSNYRYLHISCHADETGFEIQKNEISNNDFQIITKDVVRNKRVFLSTCKGGNKDLASKLIINNKTLSLIGVPNELKFVKSVLFWPSFYHLINELDKRKMGRIHIIDVLKKCCTLFNIPINYYSRINNDTKFIRRVKIRHNKVDNRKIKIKLN